MKLQVWSSKQTLEAQLPTYWVPVLKSLYKCMLSITQGPTIWVPGLLGKGPESREGVVKKPWGLSCVVVEESKSTSSRSKSSGKRVRVAVRV